MASVKRQELQKPLTKGEKDTLFRLIRKSITEVISDGDLLECLTQNKYSIAATVNSAHQLLVIREKQIMFDCIVKEVPDIPKEVLQQIIEDSNGDLLRAFMSASEHQKKVDEHGEKSNSEQTKEEEEPFEPKFGK